MLDVLPLRRLCWGRLFHWYWQRNISIPLPWCCLLLTLLLRNVWDTAGPIHKRQNVVDNEHNVYMIYVVCIKTFYRLTRWNMSTRVPTIMSKATIPNTTLKVRKIFIFLFVHKIISSSLIRLLQISIILSLKSINQRLKTFFTTYTMR